MFVFIPGKINVFIQLQPIPHVGGGSISASTADPPTWDGWETGSEPEGQDLDPDNNTQPHDPYSEISQLSAYFSDLEHRITDSYHENILEADETDFFKNLYEKASKTASYLFTTREISLEGAWKPGLLIGGVVATWATTFFTSADHGIFANHLDTPAHFAFMYGTGKLADQLGLPRAFKYGLAFFGGYGWERFESSYCDYTCDDGLLGDWGSDITANLAGTAATDINRENAGNLWERLTNSLNGKISAENDGN